MKNSTKRLLRSMGSILDISPSGDYSEYRNTQSDAELIGDYWREAGDYIKDSMTEYDSKKASKAAPNQREVHAPC